MRKSECCSLFGHEPPHIEARTARAEAAHLNDVFLSHSLSTFATVLLLCLFVSFFSPSVLLCSGSHIFTRKIAIFPAIILELWTQQNRILSNYNHFLLLLIEYFRIHCFLVESILRCLFKNKKMIFRIQQHGDICVNIKGRCFGRCSRRMLANEKICNDCSHHTLFL